MATRTPKPASKAPATRRRTTKAATKAASKPKAAAPKTTTKAKTTTAKRATPAKKAAAPVVVDAPTPVVSGPMMRKKELIDAVVSRSGMKRKDVKPAVEATLAVLGAALKEGRALNLQPMGKVKINREKKLAAGRMLVARIRQNDAGAATESTAEAAPVSDIAAGASSSKPAAE